MIDLDKAIASAVKTGKVSLGANSAIQNAQAGKAKLIVLASNCPKNLSESLEYYCKLSNIPLITHKGTSLDLGGICGKPFAVSALSIREAGDSEILKLTETAEPEESAGGNE
ncbi:MAG TPA: 50S ribosomal protein L30e [Candidatus Bathyarchaeia archaeon]|jgi:large subunit ribosomal protein L30e|nr:50S ribosomal protein L30e [Candidatus Bathyarchaeia archaeon]